MGREASHQSHDCISVESLEERMLWLQARGRHGRERGTLVLSRGTVHRKPTWDLLAFPWPGHCCIRFLSHLYPGSVFVTSLAPPSFCRAVKALSELCIPDRGIAPCVWLPVKGDLQYSACLPHTGAWGGVAEV